MLGSEARGCFYNLAGKSERIHNRTGYIERENSAGVTIEVGRYDDYKRIVAYDWEAAGNVGKFAVHRALNISENCPPVRYG